MQTMTLVDYLQLPLNRIGLTLAHFLWQGTLISLAYALLRALLWRQKASFRYLLAMVLFLAMVAAPIVTFSKIGEKPATKFSDDILAEIVPAGSLAAGTEILAESEEIPSASRDFGQVTNAGTDQNVPSSVDLGNFKAPWPVWVGVAWLVGMLLCVLPRLVGWYLLLRWKSQSTQAAEPLLRLLGKLKQRSGLRRSIDLLVIHKLLPPFSAGWWRPFIMLPASLVTRLPQDQLEAILAHELAHIRRHDYLVNLVQCMAETVLFFHPGVWWLSREIRREREICCDHAAVQMLNSRLPLVEALAELAHWQSGGSLLPLSPVQSAGQQPILQRLQRLVGAPATPPARLSLVLPLALLAAILIWPTLGQTENKGLTASEPPPPPAPQEKAATPQKSSIRGRILDRQGIVLAESLADTDRTYPLGSLFAHTVGYTAWKGDWGKSAIRGIYAAEAALDADLAVGTDIKLTLDARIQALTRAALVEAGIGRGTAVVMDPKNGELLAMVSLPDFSPAFFFPKVVKADFDNLMRDQTSPLLNRALQSYPPGSAFKLLVALAGLERGLGQRNFTCEGQVEIEAGGRKFPCWVVQKGMDGHGTLNLEGAVKVSCNCYFYQLGMEVGAERLAAMGDRFGMNAAMDFPLGKNASGRVPTPAWHEAHIKEKFTRSHLANMSIGQGHVTWTPLHATMLTATLANGGKIWKPQAVLEKSHVRQPAELLADLTKAAIRPEDLESIRKGMWAVVNDVGGTGQRARCQAFMVAGKTSTAQFIRAGQHDNITSFIAFAPYESPTLAVTVLLQGGRSGGSTCAPIAKRILEDAHAVLNGTRAPAAAIVAPTQPMEGHLRLIESVNYP